MRKKSVLVAILIAYSTAAAAPPPPGPVFEDGQAQPVYEPVDIAREKLWVQAQSTATTPGTGSSRRQRTKTATPAL
ncbi:hypothetical protein AB0C38_10310 [Amycolatopsis sp. NPDC048633]|uniref:hypothetical protein n=1 Tax=Amycolatopsis sp. NPDC048633 TaxID=3157095 RepID=UPI0033EF9B87